MKTKLLVSLALLSLALAGCAEKPRVVREYEFVKYRSSYSQRFYWDLYLVTEYSDGSAKEVCKLAEYTLDGVILFRSDQARGARMNEELRK